MIETESKGVTLWIIFREDTDRKAQDTLRDTVKNNHPTIISVRIGLYATYTSLEKRYGILISFDSMTQLHLFYEAVLLPQLEGGESPLIEELIVAQLMPTDHSIRREKRATINALGEVGRYDRSLTVAWAASPANGEKDPNWTQLIEVFDRLRQQ